jgi:PAT family beta-lactamase induction signal transducer AmpG
VRATDVFRSRRVLVLALLGFASGLPLLLTSQTLGAWLAADGVDLTTIGALSLVGLPYTFKWAWAPLLDRYHLPFLGRRRGWMLACQLGLMVAIAVMGASDPVAAPLRLALTAVVVAFLSASHDVVLDAFNADSLSPSERAAGSALYVTGYRAAMLVTGSAALLLADHVSWRTIYGGCAALMLVGVGATLIADEPSMVAPPASLAEAVVQPVVKLLRQPRVMVVLAFVALFRFGDTLAFGMVVPFLKRGVGFSFSEIATIYQLLGFVGTLVGGLAAGALVVRFGLRRSLFAFGALQALTNLCYLALAVTGPSLPLFATAVVSDNLAGAMGSAAFVAYLMSLCDAGVSATQMALLSSLSSLGGRVFGFVAGPIIAALGWSGFFATTAALALPGLLLLLCVPLAGARRQAATA